MATTALVLVQCDAIVGGAPLNVKVEAATDSTVKVTWSAPVEGTPDNYVVYFMETGTSTYAKLGEATTTMYEHDPMGKTGKYKVTADFGGTEYDGLTTPTTAPVANAAVSVSELNAAGNSGYGWEMSDGTGATYSMTSASNAPMVDFYISDFTTGYAGQPYSITSPDLGPTDPGNVVPAGAWKANSYTNPLTSETAPLPAHSNLTYFNYTDLATDPIVVGCYTEDGYYAMVKLSGYNTSSGTVQAQTWFQLVEGLRLIQH
jgi:hypothetical protein